MRADDLLPLLHGVKQTARGWMALCPAHGDKNPSLSIKGGDAGLLVHCWSGCTVQEICRALGIEVKSLFYDSDTPRHSHRQAIRPPRINRRDLAFEFDLAALDRRLRADDILSTAQGLNISAWSDKELDQAMGMVARAYHDCEHAGRCRRRSANKGVLSWVIRNSTS